MHHTVSCKSLLLAAIIVTLTQYVGAPFSYKMNNSIVRETPGDIDDTFTVYDSFMSSCGGFTNIRVDIMHMLTNYQRLTTWRVYGEMTYDNGRPSHPLKVADNDVSNVNAETLTYSTLSPFARVETGIIHFDMVIICMLCNMSFALYKEHLHICHLMLYHVIGTGPDWIQKVLDILNKEMEDNATHPDLIDDDTYTKLCDKYSEHVRKDMDYPPYDENYQGHGGFPLQLRTDVLSL
jgi:hypothetical protein